MIPKAATIQLNVCKSQKCICWNGEQQVTISFFPPTKNWKTQIIIVVSNSFDNQIVAPDVLIVLGVVSNAVLRIEASHDSSKPRSSRNNKNWSSILTHVNL